MAEIWAISTNKGGVLKTSLTTNLAGLLSENNKVLIVDTDNQGNCMSSFGKNPDDLKISIYDVLVDKVPARKAIVNVHENIDILPANDDMTFFEFDVLSNMKEYPKPFELLKSALKPVMDDYSLILVDTPPNLGLMQGNVLSVADHVLIPFQPEPFSLRSLVKIIKAIREFSKEHNPSLNILGVVATLVDNRTVLHNQILQECRRYCTEEEITVFDSFIPRTIRFASSIAYEDRPATLTDQRKHVSYYENLLVEVLQEWETRQKNSVR